MIGYRVDDSRSLAIHLYERLSACWGRAIVVDAESLEPGQGWNSQLTAWIDSVSLYVLLVGREFWSAAPGRMNRIFAPGDVLFHEIATMLERSNRGDASVLVVYHGVSGQPSGYLKDAAESAIRAGVPGEHVNSVCESLTALTQIQGMYLPKDHRQLDLDVLVDHISDKVAAELGVADRLADVRAAWQLSIEYPPRFNVILKAAKAKLDRFPSDRRHRCAAAAMMLANRDSSGALTAIQSGSAVGEENSMGDAALVECLITALATIDGSPRAMTVVQARWVYETLNQGLASFVESGAAIQDLQWGDGEGGRSVGAWPGDLQVVVAGRVLAMPSLHPETGPFPGKRFGWIGSEPEGGERMAAASFYAAFMGAECLSLAGAEGPVIVEGTFGGNLAFLRMLATATGRVVLGSGQGAGTGMGAALLAGPLREKGTAAVEVWPESDPLWTGYVSSWRAAVLARIIAL